MGRPIDEEEAINAILREYNTDDSDFPTEYQLGLSAAKKIIEQLPPAELDLIVKIQNGINATNADNSYSCGMRNGMRWCISLIDGKKPLYENCPPAQPEWNNHTVACLLAELFDDTCACNYNGIDEWLPEKCEVIDACPNPVGVVCWEQYLKHRVERMEE